MISTLVDTVPLEIKMKRLLQKDFFAEDGIQLIELSKGWIRCQVKGAGPTIVMACDPPTTLASYQDILNHLAINFRVVLIEQPGFGFSYPKAGYGFTFDQTNSALHEFLVKLDLAPYILALPCVIGFSAIALANRYPDLVSHIVLTQTPNWDQMKQWAIGRDQKGILRTPFVGQVLLGALKYFRINDWYAKSIADQAQSEYFKTQTIEQLRRGACFCLASGFQNYIFSGDPRVEPPKQPVLAIWGGQDNTHRASNHLSILEVAPNAKCIELKHCGHSPELEDPEAYSREINSFYLDSLRCST